MPNINKNIIKQAGATVANATNKAAGLSASTPEPGTIISAIQLVNGGRTIGPAALAHFAESVRNKLLSLLVNMEPIQDLHGYDSPWPAGGGKNLIGLNTSPNRAITYTGVSVSDHTDDAVTLTSNGNATYAQMGLYYDLPAGTYTLSIKATSSDSYTPVVSGYKMTGNVLLFSSCKEGQPKSFTLSEITTVNFRFFSTTSDSTARTVTFYDVQLESGSTATSWSPYSNICPVSGRTGLDVYAGPTSAIGDTTTYSMDWTTPAGTVYAGSADIVTGDIKAAPYYASYNGETLVGPWISSMDAYDPEGTPTTGAQVVDLGGTMTEYHITGQDIVTLVGDNYIWSDSGDVTITE